MASIPSQTENSMFPSALIVALVWMKNDSIIGGSRVHCSLWTGARKALFKITGLVGPDIAELEGSKMELGLDASV